MKKINKVLAVIAAAAMVASCSEVYENAGTPDAAKKTVTFTAQLGETRTAFGEAAEGKLPTLWEKGDEVHVFWTGASEAVKGTMTQAEGEDDTFANGQFTAEVGEADTYWSVYPAAGEYADGAYTFELPSTTAAAPQHYLFGTSREVAEDHVTLHYKHMAAYCKLTVTGLNENIKVKTAKFSNGDVLTGKFSVGTDGEVTPAEPCDYVVFDKFDEPVWFACVPGEWVCVWVDIEDENGIHYNRYEYMEPYEVKGGQVFPVTIDFSAMPESVFGDDYVAVHSMSEYTYEIPFKGEYKELMLTNEDIGTLEGTTLNFAKYGKGEIYAYVATDDYNYWQSAPIERAAGWYNDTFPANKDEYTVSNNSSFEFKDDDGNYMLIISGNAAPDWRNDIAHKTPAYLSGDYPIVCWHMDDVALNQINVEDELKDVRACITFDTAAAGDANGSDGNKYHGVIPNGSGSDKNTASAYNRAEGEYILSDGTALMIYNVSTQGIGSSGNYLLSGVVAEFATFQLKYADINFRSGGATAETLPKESVAVRFFGLHTFPSIDALHAWMQENEYVVTRKYKGGNEYNYPIQED